MRIDILTLFPELFDEPMQSSIVGRARDAGLVSIQCTNYRDFASGVHRTVDDKPFGGGPGMVLMCGPVFKAAEYVSAQQEGEPLRILLTPQGERLTQSMVSSLSCEPWLALFCGHYEGFDERIRTGLGCREVSLGDYVLSGGEPAAWVLVDAIVRLLPGALGSESSARDDSFSSNRLEYPQYTRPRKFRGLTVPEVLLSGDHAKIKAWRDEQSHQRTAAKRPDLLEPDESSGA